MDIDTYINQRLDPQIDWYDKKSVTCQRKYKVSQIIEIICASIIPLLAGYSSKHFLLPIIIGVLGSVIAIIESITKLNKYHENWIQYRSTCELLRYQKYLYLSQSYPYNTVDETIDNIFVKNVENIISSENNQWKNINNEREENNNKELSK